VSAVVERIALDKQGTGVASEAKSNYILPLNVMGEAGIARVINSDEVQSVLKVKGPKDTKRQRVLKKNPPRNKYKPFDLK
jgi:large subunit ribosomal protein L4e